MIPSGQTTASGTFVVSLVDDTLWEGEETIEVNGSAGSLTVTGASLALEDNDRVSAINLTYAGGLLGDRLFEETEGLQTAELRATLVGPSTFSQDTTVTLSFAGSATFGVDYALAVTSLVIPAGATTASVDLFIQMVMDPMCPYFLSTGMYNRRLVSLRMSPESLKTTGL